MSKLGRNDPCPCGSGKKYKKCCLSKNYTGDGEEDSIRKRLVQDLLSFFEKTHSDRLQDAEILFWDEFIPENHLEGVALDVALQNFWEWIVFDCPIDEDSDKTLIDLYLEDNRDLSLDEHKVLAMMTNSVISLYEVEEVFPEKGLLLKDLLMGGEYDVKEKLATGNVRKWDIFAARLLFVDNTYIMSGSVYPYHIRQKERILNDILAEFEDFKIEYPDASMDEFLKDNSEIFNFYWYDLIQNPTPIRLRTTTGEPVLISKAIFEIDDKETVMKGLPEIEGFEQDNDAYTWYGKRDKDGSATVLGRAEIRDNELILECNSKKRLNQGKRLILEALSDVIVHKADTFQDPMEVMKPVKESPVEKPDNELPFEIQQQVYTTFMQKHCENWLEDRIPALDGRTPMQAVKTEEGRRKVIELLKSFQNMEEHNRRKGRPYYDISWMWPRLRLERE